MENEIVVSGCENKSLSITQMASQIHQITEMQKEIMQKDVHFGLIPFCGKQPTLLKPGAEMLCMAFRLAPSFEVKINNLENGHREYISTCTLTKIGSGEIWATGIGSCSTMESKYRYRSAANFEVTDLPIPRDSKEKKSEYRKLGYGMKQVDGQWFWVHYLDNAKEENPDIADCYNTCLKMSNKRSHIAATLSALACSSNFTQDIEDFPAYMFGRKENENSLDAEIIKPPTKTTQAPPPSSQPVGSATPQGQQQPPPPPPPHTKKDTRTPEEIKIKFDAYIQKKQTEFGASEVETVLEKFRNDNGEFDTEKFVTIAEALEKKFPTVKGAAK